jgi:hypothetical protein
MEYPSVGKLQPTTGLDKQGQVPPMTPERKISEARNVPDHLSIFIALSQLRVLLDLLMGGSLQVPSFGDGSGSRRWRRPVCVLPKSRRGWGNPAALIVVDEADRLLTRLLTQIERVLEVNQLFVQSLLANYRFNVLAADSQQQLVVSLGSDTRKLARKGRK